MGWGLEPGGQPGGSARAFLSAETRQGVRGLEAELVGGWSPGRFRVYCFIITGIIITTSNGIGLLLAGMPGKILFSECCRWPGNGVHPSPNKLTPGTLWFLIHLSAKGKYPLRDVAMPGAQLRSGIDLRTVKTPKSHNCVVCLPTGENDISICFPSLVWPGTCEGTASLEPHI